jgi:GR25 family glycosyltransferase involved in LPS biosynthesis
LSVRIILLEGNPERATHVRDHLKPGLASQGAADPEVIAAIDSTTPDGMAEILARIGLEEKTELESPSSFMKGKLGCALSHASAWASIPDGAPALVLEDDAVVAPDLMEKAVAILEFLDREHPRWHLLHLYSPRLWADPRGDPAMPYREEFDGHHGNVGYLVSPEGRSTLMPLVAERLTRLEAADLARAQDEPHFALDHSILRWARAGVVRAFWATEHLVETIGQIGPEREAEDLHSNIFHEPRER